MNDDSSQVPSGTHPLSGQPILEDCSPFERDARRQNWQVARAVFSRLWLTSFESRLLTRVTAFLPPHPPPIAPGTSYSGKLSLTNSPQGQSVSFIIILSSRCILREEYEE